VRIFLLDCSRQVESVAHDAHGLVSTISALNLGSDDQISPVYTLHRSPAHVRVMHESVCSLPSQYLHVDSRDKSLG
jgi:hypothetical protein